MSVEDRQTLRQYGKNKYYSISQYERAHENLNARILERASEKRKTLLCKALILCYFIQSVMSGSV